METGKLTRLCLRWLDGKIVVGDRTKTVMKSNWNQEEFILFPYKHKFSRLIAKNEHTTGGHLGVAASVAKVRAKYWIINLPRMMKSIRFKCVPCRIKQKLRCEQKMAELPPEHLTPSPPFYVTGIDYFGPFPIRGEVNKRVRGKCYGILFACFPSRAIHVDLSVDCSTDSFLQTLRRFFSIRGWPRKFYSDNGSQLVAASKELKKLVRDINWKMVQEVGVTHGSEWSFSVAEAPWTNGATKALVKSVKKALSVILGEQVLTFSELQTVCFEAAQVVNQHPIGRNPTTPEEGCYVCPNNLILGRASALVPQGPFRERCSNKHRIDFIEKLVGHFWKAWYRDVFPNLVVRQKWHVDKRNVCEGDIDLIEDKNALRGEYKLGKVTKAYITSDGRVRRVVVGYKRSKGGAKFTHVERPIHKLIIIQAIDENIDDGYENSSLRGGVY